MENFNWTAFTLKIAIRAEILTIYNAWTKASEIEKWFLENADFSDENNNPIAKDANVKADFTYTWKWFLYEATEHGKIIEANRKDFVQFTFEKECLVDVSLSVKEEYVMVELIQKNIPTDDRSKQQVRLGCHSGWSFYLVNLKSVYEGGLDLRNKTAGFELMINN